MATDRFRQLPNIITTLRVLMLVPIVWCLWRELYTVALLLMAIAGASDAVDGWLARRYGWLTRFGAAVDPIADKLLVGVLFVVLTVKGHIPLWVVAIVVGRDVVILLGAGVYRWLFEEIEFSPTFISKANTAMQIVLVLVVLLGLTDLEPLAALARWVVDPYLIVVVATLGLASGLDYVVTWGRRALTRGRVDVDERP